MQKNRLTLGALLALLILASSASANNFSKERYRGWLWFEDKVTKKDNKAQKNKELTKEEMLVIKSQNEEFREELELLKAAMIRYPDNLEYVLRYKKKEKKMLDNAMLLAKSFLMVDFLNPDLANQLENPQNLYGRTAKKDIEKENNTKILKELTKKVELFLFFQRDCKYCEILERHLASFADRYGFKAEAVSADGSQSALFKTHTNKTLIEKLNLKQMPTVIAVTNDSKLRFELARGAVSIAELEENALLMREYLEQIKKSNSRDNKSVQEVSW